MAQCENFANCSQAVTKVVSVVFHSAIKVGKKKLNNSDPSLGRVFTRVQQRLKHILCLNSHQLTQHTVLQQP